MRSSAEAGAGVLDTVKGVLGIESPSKRMRELGEYAGDGFTEGLIDRTSAGFQKWRKIIEKEVGDVEAFLKRVEEVAKKVGANPNDLLGVFAFESGISAKRTNSIGATGLIQFTKPTAKGLGTTTKPALLPNPFTAIIAGGLIGTALLLNFLSGREQRKFRKTVEDTFGLKVDGKAPGTALFEQEKALGEQLFGTKGLSKHMLETIKSKQSEPLMAAYGEATGQGSNPLVRKFKKIKDLVDPGD